MTLQEAITEITAQAKQRWSTTSAWPQHFCGAYLGMGARDPVFTGPEHAALVIGPPRSGKTSAVIIPAIALWNGPVVTTSTKPDTLSITADCRQRRGDIWVWDPTGQLRLPERAKPLRWSPLLGCTNWDTAIDRAWMLTHSARPNPTGDALHWTERAAALIAPLLHAAALATKPLSVVLEWIHRHETWDALDQLSVSPESAVAHNLLSGIANTDSRELSGIWSTADSVLAAYRNTATLSATDRPNFDPTAFAKSDDTVYLVAPAARTGHNAPIVCALLDQIREAKLAARNAKPMLWALDEVANIAPLPNLPSLVADAGSQGLLMLACLQDLSQARHRWGHQADGFLTLFATTLLLPGIADTITLEAVTTLAGKVDRPQHATTQTAFLRQHHTTSTRPLPLLPENVIAYGIPGHALHLRTTNPSWLRLTPWHSTPSIRRSVEGGAS